MNAIKKVLAWAHIELLVLCAVSKVGALHIVAGLWGGIKKVVVGDQIDGGRVAAISATALQYQKGSKMVTLSLPKG